MTTGTYSAAWAHTTSADFRAWGLQLSNALTTAGWLKSADTGQIDFVTVAVPAANTAAGYEIRYLDDSLHATAPVYCKIEYGSGAAGTFPMMWITTGSGTNGAGTITGTVFTRTAISYQQATQAGTYPTFICVKDGYVGVAHMRRGLVGSAGHTFFAICRTTDSSGTITNGGHYVYYPFLAGSALQRKTYTSGTLFNDMSAFCFIPGVNTTSLVGADAQVFRHFFMAPTVLAVPFVLTYIDTEIGSESTFSATPIGVTSRTFLALGGTGTPTMASMNAVSTHRLAMQYD